MFLLWAGVAQLTLIRGWNVEWNSATCSVMPLSLSPSSTYSWRTEPTDFVSAVTHEAVSLHWCIRESGISFGSSNIMFMCLSQLKQVWICINCCKWHWYFVTCESIKLIIKEKQEHKENGVELNSTKYPFMLIQLTEKINICWVMV